MQNKPSVPFRVRRRGSRSGSNYCVVELFGNTTLLRGECWLSVLSGFVEVLGAILTPEHNVVHVRSMSMSTKSFVLRHAEPYSGIKTPQQRSRGLNSPDANAHNKVREHQRKNPFGAQSTIVLMTTARDTDTKTLNKQTEGLTNNDPETVLLQLGGESVLFARGAEDTHDCKDQSSKPARDGTFLDTKLTGCKRRVLVCGQANTSQAFDKVLNQILSTESKVIALDADVSQSDLHPIGVISACVMHSYKLSCHYLDTEEIGARFLGHTTASRNPALFFNQLMSLIMVARGSSWFLDAPLVIRVTLNKAMRGLLERVSIAMGVSSVVQVGNEDWCNPGGGIDVISFLDFHPDLATNGRSMKTDDSRNSLSSYFTRPLRGTPEVHQIPISEVPIWNSQAQIVHPIEIGTFLVFCDGCTCDAEKQPVEQNWLGFGLVCGTNLVRNYAEILSPLPRDVITRSECFLANEEFTQEDGAQMFADNVSDSIFFLPGAISGARGMKSRRNLLRIPLQ